MITLAQRVRDFRYAKGWGPDELANRAEISRTALYQIESGKTGLPRAGTLRRIAVALDVTMDDLLGEGEDIPAGVRRQGDPAKSRMQTRPADRWLPAEGGPLSLPSGPHGYGAVQDDYRDAPRSATETAHRAASVGHESILHREGELMSKLHDILHSSIGSSVARILDDLHGLVPKTRNSH